MRVEEGQLKKFIIDAGLLSEAEILRAEHTAEKKKTTLKEILLNEGKVSEDDLRRMEAYVLGIPFVNLKDIKVDFEVLSLIPEPIARNHNIIAFKKWATRLRWRCLIRRTSRR